MVDVGAQESGLPVMITWVSLAAANRLEQTRDSSF